MATTAPVTSETNILRRSAGIRTVKESAIKWFCLACAFLSIFITAGIILALLSEGIHFFREVSFTEFFGTTRWSPTYADPKYGVLPLIWGTVVITVGAGVIAIPLGLLIGIYLSEYASPRLRGILKPGLEILAGIPTVVYGFFGLFVVTPMLQKIMPETGVFNALAGSIVVGIMILPLVSSLCEDAIRAVPRGIREAAYGLGSSKLEVSWKVVLPGALSGVMAAFILALSRAVGETMAVTLAAGATPQLTMDLRQPIQTMTAYIVQISKGDTPAGTTPYYTLFAVGLTLFAMTYAMNVFANRMVKRYRQVYS